MARTPIVAGNWKMHLGRTPAHELLTALRDSLAGIEGIDMAVCPPAPWIADAADVLRGTRIGVGAQNVFWLREGAYTGEVSAPMLRAIGCEWVIVGHSERRQYFGETNETVWKRTKAALESGLRPIVCVGERLDRKSTRLNSSHT